MSKSRLLKWGIGMAAVAVLAVVAAAIAQQTPAPAPGGFAGMMVFGTVANVNPSLGVIQFQTQQGQQVWVAVTAQTQMTRTGTVTPSALQLNQTVVVSGQPLGILAQEVRIGAEGGGWFGGRPPVAGPPGAPAPGGAAQAGAPPPGPAPGPPGGPPGAGMPQPGGFRMGGTTIAGQVTSLNPLVVTTPEGQAVSVTLDPAATVSQSGPVTIAEVPVGEQAMVTGQYGQDGYYYATMVRLGELGRMGQMGAPGGMWGPGGGWPPPGQGAGQGERRRFRPEGAPPPQ